MHAPKTKNLRSHCTVLMLLIGVTGGCSGLEFEPAVQVCDLLNDTGCPAGQTCVGIETQECVNAGSNTHGQACKNDTDCASQHLCVSGPDGDLCRRRCDLSKPDSCASVDESNSAANLQGSTCLWATPNGALNLGYCTAPQCSVASSKGCQSDQLCVGGIEPHCKDIGSTATITTEGKTVSFIYGERILDQSCDALGHCGSGLVCAAKEISKGNIERRCLPACKTQVDRAQGAPEEACAPGFLCRSLMYTPKGSKTSKPMPAGQGYCRREFCHPLTHEGCLAGKKCIGDSKPFCTDPGNQTLMAACTKLADCDMNTTCVSGGGKALCVQKCDTSGELKQLACPDYLKCYELLDLQGKPKPENLGFCGPK